MKSHEATQTLHVPEINTGAVTGFAWYLLRHEMTRYANCPLLLQVDFSLVFLQVKNYIYML